MLFTSVNPAYLLIVYGLKCVLNGCLCTLNTGYSVQCTTLCTQHVVVISINVAVCKKPPLNTNEYDESKSLLLNNKLEFWPLNTTYRAA